MRKTHLYQWLRKVYVSLRDKYYYLRRLPYMKKLNKMIDKNMSIISSNCFSGRIMQDLRMQYNSPTLGLWMMPDDYLHLHVVPKSNKDLLCKGFPGVGETMRETWQNMLTDKGKERYILIDPEELLAPIANEKKFSKYADLITYLRTRYWD